MPSITRKISKTKESVTNITVLCPHCLDPVWIERVNCRIFRHAVYKDTGAQVDPHLPKEECDALVANELIYGCCGPFTIFTVTVSGCPVQYVAEICDYC